MFISFTLVPTPLPKGFPSPTHRILVVIFSRFWSNSIIHTSNHSQNKPHTWSMVRNSPRSPTTPQGLAPLCRQFRDTNVTNFTGESGRLRYTSPHIWFPAQFKAHTTSHPPLHTRENVEFLILIFPPNSPEIPPRGYPLHDEIPSVKTWKNERKMRYFHENGAFFVKKLKSSQNKFYSPHT